MCYGHTNQFWLAEAVAKLDWIMGFKLTDSPTDAATK
jgi:hypothetical protein